MLELRDRLGAEGMGDGLALASMFGAVASIKETAVNGDEGVVVVTGCSRQSADIQRCQLREMIVNNIIPFQPASTMGVDD